MRAVLPRAPENALPSGSPELVNTAVALWLESNRGQCCHALLSRRRRVIYPGSFTVLCLEGMQAGTAAGMAMSQHAARSNRAICHSVRGRTYRGVSALKVSVYNTCHKKDTHMFLRTYRMPRPGTCAPGHAFRVCYTKEETHGIPFSVSDSIQHAALLVFPEQRSAYSTSWAGASCTCNGGRTSATKMKTGVS